MELSGRYGSSLDHQLVDRRRGNVSSLGAIDMPHHRIFHLVKVDDTCVGHYLISSGAFDLRQTYHSLLPISQRLFSPSRHHCRPPASPPPVSCRDTE